MNRFALSVCAAAVIYTGCGGSQLPIAVPGVLPQTTAPRTSAVRKGDLLYVTSNTQAYAYVYMFSYPQGKLVGKIAKDITGLCSDSHGNVYMTQSYDSTSKIYQYAHGGKKPLLTLSDSYNGAFGCAIDPVTGNLAVANSEGLTVVIYQHARGKPKRYYIWFAPEHVAYDQKGNLFALGEKSTEFAVLVNGIFRRVTLNRHIEFAMGAQWDGKYMALGATDMYKDGAIRQYTITGYHGSEQGYTQLGTAAVSFYIDGSTIVASDGSDKINFFAYPGGGSPTKTISDVDSPGSLTVSVAP